MGTSGAPRIVELDVSSAASVVEGDVAGYAVFDAGKETVSRVLLINFRQFLSTSGANGAAGRGSVNVTLDFGGSGEGPEEAEVKVLQIPYVSLPLRFVLLFPLLTTSYFFPLTSLLLLPFSLPRPPLLKQKPGSRIPKRE